MTRSTDFAYAQARVQARHSRLPDAAAWQALEASRTAAHYLAAARAGPLGGWLEGLGEPLETHAIERGLRAHWRRCVDELASWQPACWQPAVRWFATLADLPWIAALPPDQERSHGWPAEARGAALAEPAPVESTQALHEAGLATLSAVAGEGAEAAAAAWLAEWRRRAPSNDGKASVALRPAELLLPRLLGAGRSRAAADGPVRQALQRLFRRHAGSAVTVTAHLAMVALDLERLRGGLVERILFEPRGAAVGAR